MSSPEATDHIASTPDYWVGRLAMLAAMCLDPRLTSGQIQRYLRSTLAEFMVSPVATETLRNDLRRHL